MVDLTRALAGASQPAAASPARSALVVGNVGRLGEELPQAVLESHRYARVAVAVRTRMRSVVTKFEPVLAPARCEGWDPAAALGRAPDDAYLCLEAPKASFWKLSTPYVELASGVAANLGARLRAAGTRRLAVVTPLDAIQQMGMESMIRNADEISLVECGFRPLVILRPSTEDLAAARSGVMAGVADMVLGSLRSIMTPKRLQPVLRRRAAQAAVEAIENFPDGVHIIDAAKLREMTGDPLS